MGGLDLLKLGSSLLGGGEKPQIAPRQNAGGGGGMIDQLKSLVGGGKNPEALNSANEIKNEAQKERRGFFGEVFNSLLARQFPNVSKAVDIGAGIGGKLGLIERKEEVYGWQHEFEFITAVTMFVPDEFLSKVTDPLAEASWFQGLASMWPLASGVDLPLVGNEKMEDRIAQKDPDAVIEFIRIVHQDIMTGVVSVSAISDLFGSKETNPNGYMLPPGIAMA